jgi:hypothetical protein
MVHNHEQKADHWEWSEENMMSAVKAFKVDDLSNYHYNICCTKKHFVKLSCVPYEILNFAQQTALSKAEEGGLVTYLLKLDNAGCGLIHKELHILMYSFCFHIFNKELQMAQHEIYESQKPHHFLALKECQKRK